MWCPLKLDLNDTSINEKWNKKKRTIKRKRDNTPIQKSIFIFQCEVATSLGQALFGVALATNLEENA